MSDRKLTTEQLEDAKRLKELVNSSGMSQTEIGELIGMSQSGVNHYTSGGRALNIDVAISFSAALKKPIEAFSPSLHKKWEQAYRENDKLLESVVGLDKLDPTVREELDRMIALLIKGALNNS